MHLHVHSIILFRQRASSRKAPPSRGRTAQRSVADTATQSLDGATQFQGSGGEETFDTFKIDMDQTVRRLENELDDVIITSPAVGGGDAVLGGVGNYGDDILPSAAENMGAGKAHVHVHVAYMLNFVFIIL